LSPHGIGAAGGGWLAGRIESVSVVPVVPVVSKRRWLVLAAVVTVSGNGLAFTSVAELAVRSWSGRALGTQNTFQNLVAVAAAPLLGLLITAAGYGSAFLLAALFAGAATVVVPRG
jgi:hypothetical protein